MRELWLFEVAVNCGCASMEDIVCMDHPDRSQSVLQPVALCVLQARSAHGASVVQ